MLKQAEQEAEERLKQGGWPCLEHMILVHQASIMPINEQAKTGPYRAAAQHIFLLELSLNFRLHQL